MTTTEKTAHLHALTTSIRDWRPAPQATLCRSAADPRWEFVSLVEEYLQLASADEVVAMVNAGAIPREHALYGSPICLAAEHDLHHLIKPLSASGAAVNVTGKDNHDPIQHALKNGALQENANTLKALLDAGAKRVSGEDALCYAAYCGIAHNVAAVLERGHDPNALCPVDGTSPLISALRDPDKNSLEVAKLLLEHGANPNLPAGAADMRKRVDLPINALVRADLSDIPERDVETLLDLMIAKGLKIDHDHYELHHPLDLCIKDNKDALARMLLQRGASPDYVKISYNGRRRQAGSKPAIVDPASHLGKSAFELFMSGKMPRTISYMIEHLGEDPEQKLRDGTPIVQIAFDPETKKVMRSAIADRQIRAAMEGADLPDSTSSRPHSAPSL